MKIIGYIFILTILVLTLVIAAKSADTQYKEIQANEILDKIKKAEPVVYDHVIIKGNLYVGKLGLPEEKIELRLFGIYPKNMALNASVINSSISITNSYIKGTADFKESIFNGVVNFENTNFDGDSQFQASKFNNDALFARSRFHRNAQFDNCYLYVFSWSAFRLAFGDNSILSVPMLPVSS